jgi:hypothetical protein
MTVSTYLEARRVLSPPLASLGYRICSTTLSLLMCRSIRVVVLRWLLLVLLMLILRFGVGGMWMGMGRLEEVALEWIEVDVTGQ